MSTPQHFQLMAHYNRVANERLYAAAAELSDEERRRDRKAFFKSIHGTFNHIMWADLIWLSRFQATEGPGGRYETIIEDDFASLRAARTALDDRIDAWAQGLTQDALDADFVTTSVAGVQAADKLWWLATHFFNHQTHHRGQVHDMLSQTGMEPPALDLHRIVHPL